MMSFHTNISTQFHEAEGNLVVNGRSKFSTNMMFKSLQDLMEWVQNVWRSLGYVVVTRRSKRNPNGFMSKVVLMCDRGGTYRSNNSSNRKSKKINCPFELEGKYLKMYDSWTLIVICDKHNHEPAPHMEGHPYAKRLSDNETRLVADLLRQNVKPQHILSILKIQNPNNVSTLRTIYNARQKIRRTEHAETTMGQVISTEESASLSPLFTGYAFHPNKSKGTTDHPDPFAIRNWLHELDSAKCGSVTEDKNLLLPREQMLMPSVRWFPSFQADLMDTHSVKDNSIANLGKDVFVYDNGNGHDTNADITAVSDVDTSTSARPFQPYRDVVLNKPEGQLSLKQFLEGDYALGQSSEGIIGREREEESVKRSRTNTTVEPKSEESMNVGIDVKIEEQHENCEYGGVQSDADMENYDSQSVVNFDMLADIWKEMSFGLESSEQMTSFHTNISTQCHEAERNFVVNSTSEFSTNMMFKCRQDMMDWVQNVGRSLGYVFVTKRSKAKPNGFVSKVVLRCDRGGISKSNKSSNRKSRKTNCPFELEGKYLKMYGSWRLKMICDKHNHEPAPHMGGHPYAMRLSDNETHLVADLSRKNVKPQDILSTLKKQNPNNLSTLKTIYNARRKIRRMGHAEKSMGQLINSEESASTSPLDTGYTFHENMSKRSIEQTYPFAVRNWVQDPTRHVSVTRDIDLLLREQMFMHSKRWFPSFQTDLTDKYPVKDVPIANPMRDVVMGDGINDYDTNADGISVPNVDEPTSARPFLPYQDAVLTKPEGQFFMECFLEGNFAHGQSSVPKGGGEGGDGEERDDVEGSLTNTAVEANNEEDKNVDGDVEAEKKHDQCENVGVQSDSDTEENDSHCDVNFDGLADIWKEMTFGLESSKDSAMNLPSTKNVKEDEEECDHSFILKEDIGYVCRVCGVVQRSIESIIEFQRPKISKRTRSYYYQRASDELGETRHAVLDGVKSPGKDFSVVDISAHPRHKKQMKSHQIEGFKFLLRNLVSENPGGCILAHAPGSGKTFMLISFIQSFMAKYPDARPLVVLPRGILATWKKEFKQWQVEDITLFDFYSAKADNRAQQLEVLKQWANTRSILFLGYKQFSTIVCDKDRSLVAVTCQEILLTYPSILILDEGHTPRNQETDVFTSVEKVQTPRKVVLSGTLYQNHVKEVFNILNLVRPKFLRMEDSKAIKRRILSRVPIENRRNPFIKNTENEFYELVEHTLLKDENFKRKVTVIEDLREMTSKVLHYYKGDFLDELPGHMDFSVILNLSPRQKQDIHQLKIQENRKFKISSDGSAIYVHPELKGNVDQVDELLEKLDEREGVKTKFFLNLLRLCESTGEKLLVFGNYLLPLNFLLRLTMKVKGWHVGKQVFMITGDHDNDEREVAMDQFNNSSDAKVFFGSIKACGEGISLVGASRIIILDVHLNPSVTRQAIGRAFRPGQVRKVYTYRLIAANSPEEEDHITCFRKESIAKMWFEWNEYCCHHEFEMETIEVKDCGDEFLETPSLNEDVIALSKRS